MASEAKRSKMSHPNSIAISSMQSVYDLIARKQPPMDFDETTQKEGSNARSVFHQRHSEPSAQTNPALIIVGLEGEN